MRAIHGIESALELARCRKRLGEGVVPPGLLHRLIAREDLTSTETAWAMDRIMSGEASPVQVAGFLVALRAKGESVSELAGLVEAADCGWVTSPGEPEELARQCLALADADPELLRRKGGNGRDYVERHYRRSRLADHALDAMAHLRAARV